MNTIIDLGVLLLILAGIYGICVLVSILMVKHNKHLFAKRIVIGIKEIFYIIN